MAGVEHEKELDSLVLDVCLNFLSSLVGIFVLGRRKVAKKAHVIERASLS